ncbi:hypothetical protein EVAR_19405_1 [Eumeta japonica]|uniref:Uncharacterized protein n=1 Tax=Eumeta variegata TaxID=151549 RepID=A0A4C1TRJ8_EUMVA|nr:hypothetical protein EVAR_19405_1 [Eumeta japonica]
MNVTISSSVRLHPSEPRYYDHLRIIISVPRNHREQRSMRPFGKQMITADHAPPRRRGVTIATPRRL